MNELRTWTFSGSEVRTVEVNGEPWWVLKDVCTVLEIKNHKEVPDRLWVDLMYPTRRIPQNRLKWYSSTNPDCTP